MSRVYCSGPLFSAEEIGAMNALAAALEAGGYETFLPHRDGLEPYVLQLAPSALAALLPTVRRVVDEAIFALDVHALLQCDAVVCNLNGRVPDEGMVVEASIAFALGTPVVFYKAAARAPFFGRDNAMLAGLASGAVAQRVGDLAARVGEAIARRGAPGTPSAALAKAAAQGARIARLRAAWPGGLGKQRWPADILTQVRAALADSG